MGKDLPHAGHEQGFTMGKKKRYMGEKAGISIFYMALLKGAVCLGCE